MSIWTPPKRIANPSTCGRCGGLRREWLDEHRRHAGFSYHRICCCGGGTCNIGPTITLTFSGVDAAVCTGCVVRGAMDQSYRVNTFAIDGVYQIDHVSTTADGCTYRSCHPISPSNQHTLSSGSACSGNDVLRTDVNAYFEVLISPDGSTTTQIQVRGLRTMDCTIGVFTSWYFFSDQTITIGSAAPNVLVCGDESGAPTMQQSSGGTVTVSVP